MIQNDVSNMLCKGNKNIYLKSTLYKVEEFSEKLLILLEFHCALPILIRQF
jgi:hypothetical protein